jgi:hypothetical protein
VVAVVAIAHNIVVKQGSTFTLLIGCQVEDPDTQQLEIRDLTGWTGAMQVRATADDATILAEADVTIETATGVVTATIPDADTAAMTWRAGVYDLIITDGTETDCLAEGDARLRRSITR